MRITEIRADTLTDRPDHRPRLHRRGPGRAVGARLAGPGASSAAISTGSSGRSSSAHDPLQPGRHWERLTAGTHDLPYPTSTSFAGVIDIALWDLMGKASGLPIHALLGGAARTEIPLYWSVGAGLREDAREDGRGRHGRARPGLRRVQDPDGLGPDPLRRRPGQGPRDGPPGAGRRSGRTSGSGSMPTAATPWAPRSARAASSSGSGLAHFEEPLPEHDMAGLREVCRALDIPVSTGEQLKHRWDFRDLDRAARTRTSSSPTSSTPAGSARSSGSSSWPRSCAKPVMPHSPSAGILSIASMHAYSTVLSAVRPHEYSVEYGPAPERIAALFEEPVLHDHGVFRLSDRPGLGPDPERRRCSRGCCRARRPLCTVAGQSSTGRPARSTWTGSRSAPIDASGSPSTHQQVGDLARLDQPDVRQPEQLGGHGRRRGEGGQRRHAVPDVQLELADHVAHRDERRAAVVAGRDPHAGPDGRLEERRRGSRAAPRTARRRRPGCRPRRRGR